MRKIILPKPESNTTVSFSCVSEDTPIFAKRAGELRGMVVHDKRQGWILRTGGPTGAYGYHETLEECLKVGEKDFNYTFHV